MPTLNSLNKEMKKKSFNVKYLYTMLFSFFSQEVYLGPYQAWKVAVFLRKC